MSHPLAYLITFTAYGTWLHGDKRGSVDQEHNRYGDAFVTPSPALRRWQESTLKNPPVRLTRGQQEVVLGAILHVCRFRGWLAHAVHVRSNHVHLVVSGGEEPEKMMADFKAYATRVIRERGQDETIVKKYWTRHGSTKYLWTKESLASAIQYVETEQGKMMAFGRTNDRSPERE